MSTDLFFMNNNTYKLRGPAQKSLFQTVYWPGGLTILKRGPYHIPFEITASAPPIDKNERRSNET
ncbi:MAG TPA: hypothetical protein VIK24_11755, partial [Pyrinomonadaceae bacterium]